MIKEIKYKTILTKTKRPSMWFDAIYTANFYRGCTHKCIYCDSRSECYNIENFNDIEVKINSIELLNKELASKRVRGTIGTGAMSDPYLPIEKKYKITSKALQLIDAYDYPVLIVTKSDLVLEDIKILESINKHTKATVVFTITTTDDELAKVIEPYAPLPSKRLLAIKELDSKGIYVGVLMMPILPFINDKEENIINIVKAVSNAGGKFIIPAFGVTLRDRQREYYYKKLDEYFPGIKEKYINTYKDFYQCTSKNYYKLSRVFKEECRKYSIASDMKNVMTWEKENARSQLTFFENI